LPEEYFEREGGKLRTGGRRLADFKGLVSQVLGARQIYEIRRSNIVRMLDQDEGANGAHMAQAVRGLFPKL
jgi:hypothetical protein